VGSRLGISTEKIGALNDYATSPLFSDAEKVTLEYADTRRDVDDELFAHMQQHYDDTIAELTMIIAWENASSRFNRVSHPIARVLEALTEQPRRLPVVSSPQYPIAPRGCRWATPEDFSNRADGRGSS
jgi:hypothetical protein